MTSNACYNYLVTIEFLPFLLVPLLVYTYFWLNPLSFTTFIEGVLRYLAEIYLGFKATKIDVQTKLAYRRYRKDARKVAKQSGYSNDFVNAYFSSYKFEDWQILRRQQKELHEEKYRNFEEELSDLLFY